MGKTVAFLDILGFRDLLNTMSLVELAEKYDNMVASTNALNRPLLVEQQTPTLFPDQTKDKPWCGRYIFSDSIILISNHDDSLSCLKLLVYAWRFLQACLAMKFPVRGGIVFGELYENPRHTVVLGKGLTAAYDLERQQEWIGIAIDESVERRFPELFSFIKDEHNILSCIFPQYQIPFKDGTHKKYHTLNWRFNLIVEKGTKSLFSETENPSVKKKIRRTLEYAKTVVESGHIYVRDQEKLPVELRSMYVGSSEPPYPHGDDL
jgi:hypothetical protein